MKWPTKNQQSMGRLAKRYFVLKDNVLSYHKQEIIEEDDMLGTPITKFFTLTSDCQVKIGIHNMQRCLKVITNTEKLWIALNGENEMEIESRWVTALNAAIASASTSVNTKKGAANTRGDVRLTVPPADYKYIWYNSDPNVVLISCDALSSNNNSFTRVALYQQSGVPSIKKGNVEKLNTFQVDLGTDVREKIHLEV